MQNQRAVGICSTRPKYFFNSNLATFQLSITYCFVVSLKFYPEHGSITFIRRLNVILYWLVFAQYKYNFGYIFYIATTTNIILDKPNIMASYDFVAMSHDDVIKWKHFRRYWPFVRGIHRSPVNSQNKDQWRGAVMFSLIFALNKRLSKQSWGWWFETPSRSLWRHCNDSFYIDVWYEGPRSLAFILHGYSFLFHFSLNELHMMNYHS